MTDTASADSISLMRSKKERPHRLAATKEKKVRLLAGVLLVLVIIIFIITTIAQSVSNGFSRSESYKNVSGAAGLSAAIDYTCNEQCDQKYNFNVYIFKESGQQVAIIHPDINGQINAALPEGDYVLFVGKQFGKDKMFPQEHVSLKNGKQLDLKLDYGEEVL